jgi:hypothetical protein
VICDSRLTKVYRTYGSTSLLLIRPLTNSDIHSILIPSATMELGSACTRYYSEYSYVCRTIVCGLACPLVSFRLGIRTFYGRLRSICTQHSVRSIRVKMLRKSRTMAFQNICLHMRKFLDIRRSLVERADSPNPPRAHVSSPVSGL